MKKTPPPPPPIAARSKTKHLVLTFSVGIFDNEDDVNRLFLSFSILTKFWSLIILANSLTLLRHKCNLERETFSWIFSSYFIALWLVSILQRPFPATVSWPKRLRSKCVRFSCKASCMCHSMSSVKIVFCLKESPEGVKSELWFSWSWVRDLGKPLGWEIEFKWMYKRSNIWTAEKDMKTGMIVACETKAE